MMGDINGMRRLGEIHVVNGRLHALQLQAFTSGVFPKKWGDQVSESATVSLLEFSYHARRVVQICQINDSELPDIDITNVVISANDPGNWENKFSFALNRLAHAQSYIFGFAVANHRKMFLADENVSPVYVKVKTDQREEASVSIFGLIFIYLNNVIPLVRSKFPDWRF